jgi:Flp pilus assembly protein TadG
VELILVLPILLLLLLGMFEFSLLLTAREHLLLASREGARTAARGGNDREVAATVERTLGTGRLAAAAGVEVQRFDHHPELPFAGRQPVAVRVHVSVTQVVPDLLRWAGISFRHHELLATTVMEQE